MNLEQALGILSKSSPYAVSTELDNSQDKLAVYKKYIYIETEIEADFAQSLTSMNSGDILFLCGSSGDGKSEILTRYSQQFKSRIDFHLDATHSFSPDQTAIEALDDRFLKTKQTQRPLVLGVNIGMLGNYAEEGSTSHDDIKSSLKAFLDSNSQNIPENHRYLDFEHYPKFKLSQEECTSEFADSLIHKLTNTSLENPFYALYQNQIQKTGHSRLTANFGLLGLESVRKTVVDLLLKARLIKDQFLTARTLLDFIHQIITGKSYLFDNLFLGGDNDLLSHIRSFDPSNIHTRKVDEFILQFSLGIEDEEFLLLEKQAREYGVFEINNPQSYLRLAYIVKNEAEFDNAYLNDLRRDFENTLVARFANNWVLHKDFDGSGSQKKELNLFYKEVLIASIHKYCNRHAPTLDKDTFFVAQYNGFKIAAELEVKPNFVEIAANSANPARIGYFVAHIQVDDQPLIPMPISIKLMELLIKITQGYRPNKHDKNAVLLLDEAIDQLLNQANRKNVLTIIKDDRRYKVTDEGDSYFEVSGLV
ncbi:DNA phosphorothioation-dependent restriction protein DptF [Parashewanella spongiae]|uniref:DNA phosphorothioation-dependent restriction protein DptF n=1 Tax=Parashewanella spongiae TaxID=342950 RepID=A0A3A6UCX3_9GAMM|nr:DNA phosphorothioation-dependent restriction protein DptF [Parashewanella spongiae]MCL1076568.1 DNA phosphorothioation-dependent restriction protein DptF [Parashewanella spongiae]RJY19527.1 DNA phosphorothioation-dependent restriction protein DptF [Parashewanella spongiae]